MPAAPLRDVPQQAVELIKAFEGIPDGNPRTVNLDPYLDPVGIWTIGWGHALRFRGRFLRGTADRGIVHALVPGGITRAQAEALLRGDLVDYTSQVQALLDVPVNDAQFGALVSFAFNVGVGALARSTLLRWLNARDFAAAAEQFLVWNKARKGGVLVELPGLTRRRRAERAMFLGLNWRTAGRRAGLDANEPRSTRGARGARGARGVQGARVPPAAKPRARTSSPKAPPKQKRAAPRGRRTAR